LGAPGLDSETWESTNSRGFFLQPETQKASDIWNVLKGTGFVDCGKTLVEEQNVSGHDLSRAAIAAESTGL
jgi:hypothetical protein